MKKILLFLLIALIALPTVAQKDVTKFLGIPVDGTKAEMRKKLIEKGFERKFVKDSEYFVGEFNGREVNLFVVTNNNKVYRIMVADKNTCDETDIKIRFNKLVHQFENNKRYFKPEDYEIGDDVDISYEMLVHNKRFEAFFYQMADPDILISNIKNTLLEKYTEEQINNPTDEIQQELMSLTKDIGYEQTTKKSVWFTISSVYGEYQINIYYDNVYNQANGDDL